MEKSCQFGCVRDAPHFTDRSPASAGRAADTLFAATVGDPAAEGVAGCQAWSPATACGLAFAVPVLNDRLSAFSARLEFAFDTQGGGSVVRVVHTVSGEALRQFPLGDLRRQCEQTPAHVGRLTECAP